MCRKCSLFMIEYIFLNMVLLSVAFLCCSDISVVIWVSVLQLTVIAGTIILYKKDYMLITVIFILLTYLFHFGQSLIIIFNFNDKYAHRSVLSKTTTQTYIKAELFAMVSLFFIGLGFLCVHKKNAEIDQERGTETTFNDKNLKKIRYAGYLVLLVSIIPAIYIDIYKILALKHGDYAATYTVYTVGVGKYISLIGQFAKPAMIIILFSYVKRMKAATCTLILSTVYLLIMMMSGDRSTNIIYLIVNFYVYFRYVRKIRKRELVLGIICCYVGLAFLSVISIFRDSEYSLDSFVNMLGKRANDGIIYSVLREFGASLLSLVYAIEFIPSYEGYNFGLTYLTGIISISPKVPEVIDTLLTKCYTFTKAFPVAYQESLGGSFLGELYYNFGWLGSIAAVLIGALIGKIDLYLSKLKEPKYIAMLLVFLPNLILWVRGYYCTLFFQSFWFALFLVLF